MKHCQAKYCIDCVHLITTRLQSFPNQRSEERREHLSVGFAGRCGAVLEESDGTSPFCSLQRRACRRSRTTPATRGRKAAEWRTSSPPRRSRWCGHLHVTEHRHKTAERQSFGSKTPLIKGLLPLCVQFEQENQRLVSEMNSLVDEVRSVTSCAARVHSVTGASSCVCERAKLKLNGEVFTHCRSRGRQIEGKVVEISRLQEIFAEKVLHQVSLLGPPRRAPECTVSGPHLTFPTAKTGDGDKQHSPAGRGRDGKRQRGQRGHPRGKALTRSGITPRGAFWF